MIKRGDEVARHICYPYITPIHHGGICQKDSTPHDIIETVQIEQHVDRFGGFKGRESCSSCGVPRAELSTIRGWGILGSQR
jgi:hypothetical protein